MAMHGTKLQLQLLVELDNRAYSREDQEKSRHEVASSNRFRELHMQHRTVHQVRETPGAAPPPHWGRATRVVCRLDLFDDLQRLDWSIVAWQHPRARVIVNEVWTDCGPLYHGTEFSLMCSKLAALFDDFSDPHPDAESAELREELGAVPWGLQEPF